METLGKLKNKRKLSDFYKQEESDRIWWINDLEAIGEPLFSFDKETIYSFFVDYPQNLSAEEREIFEKENPILAEMK